MARTIDQLSGAMTLPRRALLRLAAGAAALPALSRAAFAVDYPVRPVHIVAAYPAGAAPDIIARLIGQWLSERLGQQFIVENRPGAASNIATEAVVRAAPDGYTLLVAATPNAIRTPPTKRKIGIPRKGASSRQREIHRGTRPATNPGAMKRKTAEATIANCRLLMP